MTTITIKKDDKTGEAYFDLEDIAHLFEDPKLIHSYEIKELDDQKISIIFFDENKNVVPVKEFKE